MNLRKSRLYNFVVRFKRQRQSVRIAPKHQQPKIINSSNRTRYLGIAIIVLLILSIIPVIKLAWDYGHLKLTILTDQSSIEAKSFEIENHAVYILDDDMISDKKFVSGVYVLSFNHKQRELSIINVSPDFVIFVPYLGKTLSLKSIYNNAVAVNKEPYIAINSAVKTLLGVSMQGYTVINSKDFAKLTSLVALNDKTDISTQINNINIINWLSLYAHIVDVSEKISTTASSNQLMTLIGDVDSYKLKRSLTIADTFGVRNTYSFGTGLEPDYNLINQALIDVLRLTPVLAEQIKVEVFNASGQSGLAGRISRLLSNYGVNVVRFSNAPKIENKTTLYVREDIKAPLNIDLIQNLIRNNFQVSKENYEYNSTGDLVLVLGKDAI